MVFQSTSALTTKPRAPSCSSCLLAVLLPEFAPPAVEHLARDAMPRLAVLEMGQGSPPIVFVTDVGQVMDGLGNPAQFGQGAGEGRTSVCPEQGAQQLGGTNRTHLERTCHTQQVVPVLDDPACVNPVPRQPIENAVVSPLIDAPET